MTEIKIEETKEKLTARLYQESWDDKWESIEELLDIEDYEGIMDIIFDFCPFCNYVINTTNVIVDTKGTSCGDLCPIDHSICGAEDCLLEKLYKFEVGDMDEDENYNMEELLREIINEMKSHVVL